MREKKNIIAGKTSVTTWRMIYIYMRVPHSAFSRLLAGFKPCLLFIGFYYVAKKPRKTINCI